MFLIHTYQLHLTNPLMVIWFMLWYRASDQSKRMFVLASLYGQLLQCDGNDRSRLEEVNRELRLARCAKALSFPAAISKLVWGNVLPIHRVSLDHEEHYISRLVKKTPCWLWYADAKTRHDDIRQLVDWLKQRPQVCS